MGSRVKGVWRALVMVFCMSWLACLPARAFEAGAQVALGAGMQMLEDSTGLRVITPATAGDAAWQTYTGESINLGFSRSAFWFYTEVTMPWDSPGALVLEERYALIDELDVWWHCESGATARFHTGDALTWWSRPVPHHSFLFPLTAGARDRCQLLMRARNTEAMELPLVLWEQGEFLRHDRWQILVDGLFFGAFMVMAIYNFMLFYSVRDGSYLFYAAFVLSMLLFFASQMGYLYQWAFPGHPRVHHYSIPLVLAAADIFATLFFARFLKLYEALPAIWRLTQVLLVVTIIALGFCFVLPYKPAIIMLIVLAAIMSATGLLGASILSLRGMRAAKLLVAGWLAFMFFVIIMVFSKLGLMRIEFISDYGLRFGSAIEVVMFSFALSFRIHEERRAKEEALRGAERAQALTIEAQAQALVSEREARAAKEQALVQQQQQNERLEVMVRERTHDLEDALKALERSHRELHALSISDGLTNVFNRRFFNEKMVEEWQRLQSGQSRDLALLMIDIDHFKAVNDTHGHLIGDRVLVRVAALLKQWICRPADSICRYGGEEFAVLMPDTDVAGAEKVASLVLERIRDERFALENGEIRCTVSIGIAHSALYPKGNGYTAFIAQADRALYEAKEAGRNRHVLARPA